MVFDAGKPKSKKKETQLSKLGNDIVPFVFAVGVAIVILGMLVGLAIRLFTWAAGF